MRRRRRLPHYRAPDDPGYSSARGGAALDFVTAVADQIDGVATLPPGTAVEILAPDPSKQKPTEPTKPTQKKASADGN
jgi:hypothetical protein